MDKLLESLTERNIIVNQVNLDLFWKFIYERHLIWYKRFVLHQAKPWTEDGVLTEYKFTNVYRELDKGTIFLLDHIVGHGTPMEQVFNIIVYRMFNRIETWEAARFLEINEDSGQVVWEKKMAFEVWRNRMNAGLPLYTDAHMVCAYEHFPGADKLARFEYIFDGVTLVLPTLMLMIDHAKSLEKIHKALTKIPGIGPFLAYEIAVDISYCDWNNLGEDEWANPGPGCQRGLKFLFEGLKTQDCLWMIRVLRQAQSKEFKRLNLPFDAIAYQGKELTLRNIEHCCCEAFKYFKATYGTGRPRNRFTPKSKIGTDIFKRLKG